MSSTTPARPRPPLGLPSGSIRALLTILIVVVVIVHVIRNQVIEPVGEKKVDPVWIETLMIALAHYFTSRRFITLPAAVIRQLEQDRLLEEEAHPLYLPKHSIRVIIVAAFVGMAVYLGMKNHLVQEEPLSILGVVLAYLLGMVTRRIFAWWTEGKQTDASRSWEDAKAVVVLGLLLFTASADLLNHPDWVPPGVRNTSLALVLFYFGSR